MRAYGLAVVVMAVLFVCIGIALLVRTAAAGGGTAGYLLGALFIALGAGRLALQRRASR